MDACTAFSFAEYLSGKIGPCIYIKKCLNISGLTIINNYR